LGFNPGRDKSFLQYIQSSLGAHAAYSRGTGVKWPGCEVDHCALPSSAEVYNKWNYAFASPYAFMAWIRTTILFFFINSEINSAVQGFLCHV